MAAGGGTGVAAKARASTAVMTAAVGARRAVVAVGGSKVGCLEAGQTATCSGTLGRSPCPQGRWIVCLACKAARAAAVGKAAKVVEARAVGWVVAKVGCLAEAVPETDNRFGSTSSRRVGPIPIE